ncbi:MAG: cystathionine beta-lyase [Hyphomicrobiaceae bacterium]|nr:cystathionine beta-lyase [Hyphomicrobiaceae bacterium]MCC0024535.1 cystathionine beta-lyase [Hyphomicrobiaceae bacterium]
MAQKQKNSATFFAHAGRDPQNQYGFVNVPVVHGSTVLYPDLETFDNKAQRYSYAREGNPTSDALQDVVTQMEGGAVTRITPSGLQAACMALMSVASAGKTVLLADCVYEPTRNFANGVLKRMGVNPVYFDPRIGSGISDLINDDVCAIYLETPGSVTFEMQDLPAIAAARGERDIPILIDNSWASPLFHQPLALGADVVVHTGSKYFGGHSDLVIGTMTANERWADAIVSTHHLFGSASSPDDIYLTLRGLKTLRLRMDRHSSSAQQIANWLVGQDGVKEVIHPALPSHPDNHLFKKYFSGSGSTFAFELEPASRMAVGRMLDFMEIFSIGVSFGGFESLILSPRPGHARTAVPYHREGNLIRVHIGSEDADDLQQDLAEGLKRYNRARN